MLASILLFPLLGFLSGSLFGVTLGFGVCIVTTTFLFLSFISSLYLASTLLVSNFVYKLKVGIWLNLYIAKVDWTFYFDSLTIVMLVVVTFISTLVHLYSIEYMAHDPHLPRFMSYLSLFTFFMLMLITANNFLQLFLGWEGVGLSSYLLINFWFTRIQANKAAIKAMLVNRIGDFFLLLAIFCINNTFKSLDYDVVFSAASFFENMSFNFGGFLTPTIDAICLFLFLGAVGKSAQLGLHTWLPDAMEGPTPVSALIHAATMVTAGVFLIIRTSYFFELSPTILFIVALLGAITAFFAASTGLFQNDMKKVIAYSTCSQLGYMVFACGLSAYDVAIFHLSNHAFFKALLFLGSGSIIHAVANEQDMRKLGGLRTILPFSYSVTLIGSLALMGFPFLAGFYSKDLILEIAYAKQTSISLFCYILGCFAAFCTAFYSTRLLFMVFLNAPNGNKKIILHAHESSWKMGTPLFILTILSITIGYLSKDFFVGFGTPFWGSAIFMLPTSLAKNDSEFITYFFKILPLLFSFLGSWIAFSHYLNKKNAFFSSNKNTLLLAAYNFVMKKWYFDKFYNKYVVLNSLEIGHSFSYKNVDRGLLEHIGPFNIVQGLQNIFKKVNESDPIFFLQNISVALFILLLSICFLFFFSLSVNVLLITTFIIYIFI